MKDEKTTYTAPAVIACTDAVQNTKFIDGVPTDGNRTGDQLGPGSVGFYL